MKIASKSRRTGRRAFVGHAEKDARADHRRAASAAETYRTSMYPGRKCPLFARSRYSNNAESNWRKPIPRTDDLKHPQAAKPPSRRTMVGHDETRAAGLSNESRDASRTPSASPPKQFCLWPAARNGCGGMDNRCPQVVGLCCQMHDNRGSTADCGSPPRSNAGVPMRLDKSGPSPNSSPESAAKTACASPRRTQRPKSSDPMEIAGCSGGRDAPSSPAGKLACLVGELRFRQVPTPPRPLPVAKPGEGCTNSLIALIVNAGFSTDSSDDDADWDDYCVQETVPSPPQKLPAVKPDEGCTNAFIAFIINAGMAHVDGEAEDDEGGWDDFDDEETASSDTRVAAPSCGKDVVDSKNDRFQYRKVSPDRLTEINRRWLMAYDAVLTVSEKKVSFASDDRLSVVQEVEWVERKGPWEECARDRDRFTKRIEETRLVIGPVLCREHRDKVYRTRILPQQEDGQSS